MFREALLRDRLLLLNARLPAGSPRFRIFGDKGMCSWNCAIVFEGFGLTNLCIRPIMHPVQPAELAFNARMSSLRITNGMYPWTVRLMYCHRMGFWNRFQHVSRHASMLPPTYINMQHSTTQECRSRTCRLSLSSIAWPCSWPTCALACVEATRYLSIWKYCLHVLSTFPFAT